MELLGIVLSVPVAFVASMLYCLVIAKVISKWIAFSRLIRRASYVLLALLLVEILLLVTIGAVRSRVLLGPGFYVAHMVFFFLCTPALANILVLQQRAMVVGRWYVAGLICTVFAFGLVMLQVGVSEALYGVDDEGGPFSTTTQLQIPQLAMSFASEGCWLVREDQGMGGLSGAAEAVP
jgi:hypothetical protein